MSETQKIKKVRVKQADGLKEYPLAVDAVNVILTDKKDLEIEVNKIDEKANKVKTFIFTAKAKDWISKNSIFEQEVEVPYLVSDGILFYDTLDTNIKIPEYEKIIEISSEINKVKLKASALPHDDLQIQLIVNGSAQNEPLWIPTLDVNKMQFIPHNDYINIIIHNNKYKGNKETLDLSKNNNQTILCVRDENNTLDIYSSSHDGCYMEDLESQQVMSPFSGIHASTVDLSYLNISKLTSLSYFFNESDITSLLLQNWDTSNITNMDSMFNNARLGKVLDLSHFNFANIQDGGLKNFMGKTGWADKIIVSPSFLKGYMIGKGFSGYIIITRELDFPLSDFPTNIPNRPENSLNGFDSFDNFDKISASIINFSGKCSNLQSISKMFGTRDSGENPVTIINGLSSFDTTNVTDMSGMFDSCNRLGMIDLSSFNFSKVHNLSNLFAPTLLTVICKNQEDIDKIKLDDSNVNEAREFLITKTPNTISKGILTANIWRDNSQPPIQKISFTNTKPAFDPYFKINPDLSLMQDLTIVISQENNIFTIGADKEYFLPQNCNNLFAYLPNDGFGRIKEIDLSTCSNLKCHKDTEMRGMFEENFNLTTIDLSGLDTSNVITTEKMFAGCLELTSLDLSNFNTSKVTNMREMFSGCRNLTTIDLSSFDTSNVTDMSGMFDGCNFNCKVYCKTQEDKNHILAYNNSIPAENFIVGKPTK